jgi:hypothetical protein
VVDVVTLELGKEVSGKSIEVPVTVTDKGVEVSGGVKQGRGGIRRCQARV